MILHQGQRGSSLIELSESTVMPRHDVYSREARVHPSCRVQISLAGGETRLLFLTLVIAWQRVLVQ